MPQIQILEPAPGFGSQLAGALGGGLGKGLSQGISKGIDQYYKQKENERKQQEFRENTKQAAEKGLGSHLKQFYPSLEADPQASREISKNIKSLIDKDVPLTVAYERAISDYIQQTSPKQGKEASTQKFQFPRMSRERVHSPLDISPESRGYYQSPQSREGVKGGIAGLAAEHPLQALASGGVGGLRFLENLASIFQAPEEIRALTSPEKIGGPGLPEAPLSELLREASGISKLPPQMQKEAEVLSGLTELLPVGSGLSKIFSGLQKSRFDKIFNKLFRNLASRTGKSGAKVAEESLKAAQEAGVDLGKVAAGEKKEAKRLYDLLKEDQTPTVARAERVEKGTPKFAPKEEAALREKQLKEFPKYEEEIAKDARERAERLAEKEPKTQRGEIGRQQRRARAQENYPKVQESYRNSIARTRAIEDAYVKASGDAKEKLKPLLQKARQDLKEAQDAVRQTINNAKTGESRKGVVDQTKAAREKILKIQDEIADGKEIKLGKADYNPEIVKEAKRVEKLKEPAGHPKDLFYEKVHDNYEKVYQERLDSLNKELKGLKGNIRSLSDAEHVRNLQKEKEVLDKLINQTKAEKLIHRRKLRLREMAERKRAEQRFKDLKPAKSPKVEEVSKAHFERLKKSIPQEEVPKVEKEIRKQQASLKEDLNTVKEASTEKEAAQEGVKAAQNIFEHLKNIVKKYPKSSDAIIGIGTAFWNDAKKEYDLPFSGSSVTAAALGRGGTGARSMRYIYNQMASWAIRKYRIQKAADAYRKGFRGEDEIVKLKKKYSSSIMKEAREEAFGS